jgi:hypothetical protein
MVTYIFCLFDLTGVPLDLGKTDLGLGIGMVTEELHVVLQVILAVRRVVLLQSSSHLLG